LGLVTRFSLAGLFRNFLAAGTSSEADLRFPRCPVDPAAAALSPSHESFHEAHTQSHTQTTFCSKRFNEDGSEDITNIRVPAEGFFLRLATAGARSFIKVGFSLGNLRTSCGIKHTFKDDVLVKYILLVKGQHATALLSLARKKFMNH